MGAIEGEAIGQIVGGQIGGRSSAPLHRGCIWPFTHWQVHPACAGLARPMKALAIIRMRFMAPPLFL